MTIDAMVLEASASILIVNCFVSALNAEETIRDKSPDGKLALRLTRVEIGWDTAIIDVRGYWLPVYERSKTGEAKPSLP
jgi:hypothetical protein